MREYRGTPLGGGMGTALYPGIAVASGRAHGQGERMGSGVGVGGNSSGGVTPAATWKNGRLLLSNAIDVSSLNPPLSAPHLASSAAHAHAYQDETGEEGLSGYPYDYGYDSGMSFGADLGNEDETEQEKREMALRTLQETQELEFAKVRTVDSDNAAAASREYELAQAQAHALHGHDHDEANVDAWLSGSGTFGTGTAYSTPPSRGGYGMDSGPLVDSWGRLGPSQYGHGGQHGHFVSAYEAERQQQAFHYQQQQYRQQQHHAAAPAKGGPPYGVVASTDFGPNVSIAPSASSASTVSQENVWAFDPAVLLIRSRRSPLRLDYAQSHGNQSYDHAQSSRSRADAMMSMTNSYEDGFATAPQSQIIEDPALDGQVGQAQEHGSRTGEAGTDAPGDPVAESGLDIHRWLAESVWNFCMTPYLPGKPCSPDNSPKPTSYAPYSFDSVAATEGGKQQHSYPWMANSEADTRSPSGGMKDWFDDYSGPVHVSPPLTPSPSMLYPNPFGLRQSPSSSFIDFVHRTLSQTLLSPSAVILSLWYIRRFAIHAGGGQEGVALRRMLMAAASEPDGRGGEEGVRRVLTLGLACSNKWLDDNTFTNKSWSDVTRLPLPEINRLELLAIAPLSFDLSVQAHEWRDWVTEVERQVTPFVTDHRLVLAALGKMAIALKLEEERFDIEVVLPRLRVESAEEWLAASGSSYPHERVPIGYAGSRAAARSPTVSPVTGTIGDSWMQSSVQRRASEEETLRSFSSTLGPISSPVVGVQDFSGQCPSTQQYGGTQQRVDDQQATSNFPSAWLAPLGGGEVSSYDPRVAPQQYRQRQERERRAEEQERRARFHHSQYQHQQQADPYRIVAHNNMYGYPYAYGLDGYAVQAFPPPSMGTYIGVTA